MRSCQGLLWCTVCHTEGCPGQVPGGRLGLQVGGLGVYPVRGDGTRRRPFGQPGGSCTFQGPMEFISM